MKLTDFNNISKNVLKFHSNDLKTTPPEAEFTINKWSVEQDSNCDSI